MARQDVSNKLLSVEIVDKQANIDGKDVNYKRLEVTVEISGQTTVVEFVPSSGQGKSAYTLLALASVVE